MTERSYALKDAEAPRFHSAAGGLRFRVSGGLLLSGVGVQDTCPLSSPLRAVSVSLRGFAVAFHMSELDASSLHHLLTQLLLNSQQKLKISVKS